MEVAASGPDALWLALKQAQAGDTIVLAPGQYGDFSFFALNFAGESVSIRSADPSDPAVFTRINLDHSSGLSFSEIEVVTIGGTAVNVQHSARIAFADMDIHGAARGVGNAVIIRDSTEVSLVRSQIHDVGTGVSFLGSGFGLELAENVFRGVANGDIRGAGPAVSVYGNVHAAVPTVASSGGGGNLEPMLQLFRGDEPVIVTTSDALWNALKSAKAGDTILLKEGVYTPVTLNLFKFEGAEVTIRSQDPAHEAVLNGLKITNSSGLIFKDVEVNVIGGSTGIQVMTSKDIHFEGLNVHGAGLRNGSGIQVRASTDVSITNSDLRNLGLGVSHSEAGNLLVANNSFSNLQSDGVTGGSSSRVTVTGNTFTSFVPKEGDHPDAIQFWGSVSGVATDIVITNNVIQRGDGQVIQGIFLQDIQNVTITGNAMSGTMFNGISLSNVKTALVQDNFVQGYTDMPTRIIVRKGSTDVTVNDNTTQQIADYHDAGPNPRYSASNNTIVDPSAVGDIGQMLAWAADHGLRAPTTVDGWRGPFPPPQAEAPPILVVAPPAGPLPGAEQPWAVALDPWMSGFWSGFSL